jgi:hypothetical protein
VTAIRDETPPSSSLLAVRRATGCRTCFCSSSSERRVWRRQASIDRLHSWQSSFIRLADWFQPAPAALVLHRIPIVNLVSRKVLIELQTSVADDCHVAQSVRNHILLHQGRCSAILRFALTISDLTAYWCKTLLFLAPTPAPSCAVSSGM